MTKPYEELRRNRKDLSAKYAKYANLAHRVWNEVMPLLEPEPHGAES